MNLCISCSCPTVNKAPFMLEYSFQPVVVVASFASVDCYNGQFRQVFSLHLFTHNLIIDRFHCNVQSQME